ncbi:MAG: PTS transporter subunit EIIC [Tepidanaerobacteraceae bacterium]|nr:PTS transporter subunit EIIC [Tepidanaerobacteraceae bacterium]
MKGNFGTAWIEKNIMSFANKLAMQRHLKAIQSAFMSAMPLMIIGSFCLILAEPPVDYNTLNSSNIFYGFLKAWADFAAVAGTPLYFLFDVTLGCLSLYVAIGAAYFLSKHYSIKPIIPVIVTIISFLMLNSQKIDGGFSSAFFDGTGLFAAMIVSLLTTELYRVLIQKKVGVIHMPEGVPPALANSFEALVPVTIMSVLTMLLGYAITSLTGTTFPQIVLSVITPLIKFVDNVFGVSIIAIIQQVLWWFGIHDTAIGTVISPIRDANIAMNASAYAAGTKIADLPYVFTAPFWWVFVQIGGSGATFSLALILLKSKSKQLKSVGKLGIIPAFFNINEPILFGLPIVLNPLFFIPFLAAETANAVITYLCMASNLVAKTFVEPGWNLFTPIGAFISTLDYKAVILVLVLMVIDGLIYYPFFKVYEKQLVKEEQGVETK